MKYIYLTLLIIIYYLYSKLSYEKYDINKIIKTKIIYICYHTTNWELDYIKYDICKNMDTIYIDDIEKIDNTFLTNNYNLINNNILIFSSNEVEYNDINNIVNKLNPLIIIHLSDEVGNKKEYDTLANKTQLLLREYNHFGYDNYNNIYQIPLGYMQKMLSNTNNLSSINRNDIKSINDRKYIWSFIGNIKQDRLELINLFKNNFKSYFCDRTAPQNMFNIYNNSIFVPNGRGNVTLDCLRLYEASLSGAIPIVVGDMDEINITFNYNNNLPPFIYEKSWSDAIIKCNYLLNNKNELINKQTQIILWWNNIIKDIQKKIQNIINYHLQNHYL